jgi:hypothetical protein
MRGALAVLAGLGVVIVLSLGTDMVLHATGLYPPWGQPVPERLLVLATLYRLAYGVLGGFVAARLAPSAPVRHAVVLGVIGTLLALAGLIATWDAGPAFGPRWYPITLVATALPTCWLGGRWASRAGQPLL